MATKYLKILFLLFCLPVFSGCGEAFRAPVAYVVDDAESETSSREIRPLVPQSTLPEQAILMDYIDEMQGDERDMREVHSMIEAFDVVFSPEATDQVKIDARMTFGCDLGLEFSNTVSRSLLRTTQAVNLGIQEEFQVLFRCAQPSCTSAVAVFKKVSGSFQSTQLIALEILNGFEGEILYGQKDLKLRPYFSDFRYDHIQEFEAAQACAFGDEETTQTAFLGDFFEDPINGIVDYVAHRNTYIDQGLSFLRSLGF